MASRNVGKAVLQDLLAPALSSQELRDGLGGSSVLAPGTHQHLHLTSPGTGPSYSKSSEWPAGLQQGDEPEVSLPTQRACSWGTPISTAGCLSSSTWPRNRLQEGDDQLSQPQAVQGHEDPSRPVLPALPQTTCLRGTGRDRSHLCPSSRLQGAPGGLGLVQHNAILGVAAGLAVTGAFPATPGAKTAPQC